MEEEYIKTQKIKDVLNKLEEQCRKYGVPNNVDKYIIFSIIRRQLGIKKK